MEYKLENLLRGVVFAVKPPRLRLGGFTANTRPLRRFSITKSFSGRYRILKKGARWLLVKVPPKISLKTEILGHKGGLHAESAPPPKCVCFCKIKRVY